MMLRLRRNVSEVSKSLIAIINGSALYIYVSSFLASKWSAFDLCLTYSPTWLPFGYGGNKTLSLNIRWSSEKKTDNAGMVFQTFMCDNDLDRKLDTLVLPI